MILEETLHLVSNLGTRAGAQRGRRLAGVAAAAVVTAALAACTNIDAADQQVIDRLSKLDVMRVPPGATELSWTSSKGGGNSVIRNASSVTLVYATTQTPPRGRDGLPRTLRLDMALQRQCGRQPRRLASKW